MKTDRFQIWRGRFEEAIEKIAAFRSDSHDGMRLITCWMMDIDTNPYGYLMPHDARATESAEGFAGLLHSIHHALVDDGEISFLTIDGRPMIVFAGGDEIGQVDIRSEADRMLEEKRGYPAVIGFLEGIEGFIEASALYEADRAAKRLRYSKVRDEYIERRLTKQKAEEVETGKGA